MKFAGSLNPCVIFADPFAQPPPLSRELFAAVRSVVVPTNSALIRLPNKDAYGVLLGSRSNFVPEGTTISVGAAFRCFSLGGPRRIFTKAVTACDIEPA
jgi:hypothetical protein